MSNEDQIQKIASMALAELEKLLPWSLTASGEESEERMEAHMAIVGAIEVQVEMITTFEHTVGTNCQLADRLSKELDGQNVVHDLTPKIKEKAEVLVDELKNLVYISGLVKDKLAVDYAVKRVVRRIYLQTSLDVANGIIR